MNCLILSAGKNTRLDTGIPKSLVKINGESLLSRHIRIFKSVGVTKFCLISGYGAEKLQKELSFLTDSHEVEIELYHNEKFDLENGFSVYTAKKWSEELNIQDFFLTMGDHIFHPDFVKDFVTKSAGKSEFLQLVVDKPGKTNSHIDVDDVTKVCVSKELQITSIGKNLTNYDYFDTGLFKLKKEVFYALERCFEQNKYTISDMVTHLASQNEAVAIPINGYVWNDVDNYSDLKNTQELLANSKL